jgi:hypothetical protein
VIIDGLTVYDNRMDLKLFEFDDINNSLERDMFQKIEWNVPIDGNEIIEISCFGYLVLLTSMCRMFYDLT